MSADLQEVALAGSTHLLSVAELERDVTALATRWTGDAASGSFEKIGGHVSAGYQFDGEFANTISQLGRIATAARNTHDRFSELADPGIELRDLAFWDPYNDSIGGKVAAELRATYSSPLQADASTMPLGEKVSKVTFVMPGVPGGGIEEPGGGKGGGGGSYGGSGNGGGAGTSPATVTDTDGTKDGQTNKSATDGTQTTGAAGNGSQDGRGGSGTQAGTGAGTGSATPGAGSGTGTGLDNNRTTDPFSTDTSPLDGTDGTVAPLLTSAGTVSPSGRTGGAGTSGVRAGAGTASPLGMRSGTNALRSTAGTVSTTSAGTTGARATSGPFGMPGAAGAGQRGQGDGKHRTPAYLIDRANGEELVGGLPLVGPGVIGEWRPDGADARRPEPPIRNEPRRN